MYYLIGFSITLIYVYEGGNLTCSSRERKNLKEIRVNSKSKLKSRKYVKEK